MSTQHASADRSYPDVHLFVDGKWRSTARTLDVVNPADESVIGQVACASRTDLDDAVAAARRAFATWRITSPEKRGRIMLDAAARIRQQEERIATVMTLEQGKPIEQSRLEIRRACDIIEWDANEGRRVYGRQIPAEFGMAHLVLRQPIGVVAAFSPWNFPISSPARKLAGAVAFGCSIVLKASEETPASAMLMVRAFEEAGLPPGVINLVFGNPAEISAHLIAHPDVRLLTFTGSVPVGRTLASMAGQHLKPAIMELGGHGPVFVCDDVDVEEVAKRSAFIKSRNAGQVCVAPTRWFVHERIHGCFVEALSRCVSTLRIGDGLDPATELGPLANARRLQVMERLVGDAAERGARVVAGGRRHGDSGFFYPLTVLADVPEAARCMSEEPFGPVALVNSFRSLDEAIQRANSLPFGLAAYGFTNNADHVATMTANVQCGNLSINHFVASVAETPFGGVKDSGYGREGGTEGLQAYTVIKNVSHLTRPVPPAA